MSRCFYIAKFTHGICVSLKWHWRKVSSVSSLLSLWCITFYRAMAKKTITKTARRVGLKQKQSSKRQKYVFPTPTVPRKGPLAISQASYDSEMSTPGERPLSTNFEDDLASKHFCKPSYKKQCQL